MKGISKQWNGRYIKRVPVEWYRCSHCGDSNITVEGKTLVGRYTLLCMYDRPLSEEVSKALLIYYYDFTNVGEGSGQGDGH